MWVERWCRIADTTSAARKGEKPASGISYTQTSHAVTGDASRHFRWHRRKSNDSPPNARLHLPYCSALQVLLPPAPGIALMLSTNPCPNCGRWHSPTCLVGGPPFASSSSVAAPASRCTNKMSKLHGLLCQRCTPRGVFLGPTRPNGSMCCHTGPKHAGPASCFPYPTPIPAHAHELYVPLGHDCPSRFRTR